MNNGTCVKNAEQGKYVCECPAGFSGQQCDGECSRSSTHLQLLQIILQVRVGRGSIFWNPTQHNPDFLDLLAMASMRHSDTVSQHGLASDVSRRITSSRDHAPPITVQLGQHIVDNRPNPTQLTETITIGVRAIFGGGWIDFARKIWGSARKMNSRTNMINRTRQESVTTSIVENRRRTYIYVYIVLLSSI